MTLTICEHQDRLLASHIAEAVSLGERLHLTEAERVKTRTTTMASIDATEEQRIAWLSQFIPLVLEHEGRRCPKCGHIAKGRLSAGPSAMVSRAMRRHRRSGLARRLANGRAAR
jgi:hypothetical protein